MINVVDKNVAPNTVGLILHWAVRYDHLVWLLTFGREQAFREKILRLARLEAGESVLDVGSEQGLLPSRPNDMLGRRARCMGSTRRRRCLRERIKRHGRQALRLASRVGLPSRCRFKTVNSMSY